MNMAVELATCIQWQSKCHRTRHGTQSLQTYYNILEGNSDTECLRSELTAITRRIERKLKQKVIKVDVCEQRRGGFETKRHEKSCGRSLLLSLFIASSIQQGGASEPGVQPGQAGASAKRVGGWGWGSGRVGKGWG